jgi:hypothetical protein
VPPEYARWVGGVGATKVAQYSLKLTFPWCEPLVCNSGGFSQGFLEGMLSSMISTIEPYRRVMSDTSQFANTIYSSTANPYPSIYDFENRNKSCAGQYDNQPT